MKLDETIQKLSIHLQLSLLVLRSVYCSALVNNMHVAVEATLLYFQSLGSLMPSFTTGCHFLWC